jgi:hypothetical protein
MIGRLTVALLVALLAGCGGGIRPEALQKWVGRPAATLEKDWGTPTREATDGDLRVLIYEEVETRRRTSSLDGTKTAVRRGEAQQSEQDLPRESTVSVRSYRFWVDAAGTIVRATVRAY